MVAKEAAVDPRALLPGRARDADLRAGQDAVPPVQPAVRPPLQPVDYVVADAVVVKAVEHHLRRGVRHVVAIAIRDE